MGPYPFAQATVAPPDASSAAIGTAGVVPGWPSQFTNNSATPPSPLPTTQPPKQYTQNQDPYPTYALGSEPQAGHPLPLAAMPYPAQSYTPPPGHPAPHSGCGASGGKVCSGEAGPSSSGSSSTLPGGMPPVGCPLRYPMAGLQGASAHAAAPYPPKSSAPPSGYPAACSGSIAGGAVSGVGKPPSQCGGSLCAGGQPSDAVPLSSLVRQSLGGLAVVAMKRGAGVLAKAAAKVDKALAKMDEKDARRRAKKYHKEGW